MSDGLIDKKKYFSFLNEIKKDKENSLKYKDNVLIVDGNNLILRTFSSLPNMNENGNHVGAIVGSLKSLAYTIRMVKPSKLIIVFDGKGGSKKRREIYSDYKGKRKMRVRVNRIYTDIVSTESEDESLLRQISRTIQYFECLPCKIICMDDIEADDTISYITETSLSDSRVTIMSTDRDFLQLVSDRVSVWSPTKKTMYNPSKVKSEYNFSSSNFLLFRIMDGDKSDNIDGIPYAGPKVILKHFPILSEDSPKTLENLFEFASYNLSNGKFYQKVLESKDLLNRNFKLMQLKDVDITNRHKLNISSIIESPIPRMNKIEFIKMMFADSISDSINNVDKWLIKSFGLLDISARAFNEDLKKNKI